MSFRPEEFAAYYRRVRSRLVEFIDEGQVPAYKFGRVIRLKQSDVDAFIEASRVEPGTLEHLYPEVRTPTSVSD